MIIKTLSNEEIETLQVDSALRLIGEYSKQLVEVNQAISQSSIRLGQAKIELDSLKNDKLTLIELLRSMKVIAQRA